MILAIDQGEAAGITMLLAAIGIPLFVVVMMARASIRSRRAPSPGARPSSRPGLPGQSAVTDPGALPPSPHGTPGPYVTASVRGSTGTWLRVAFGPAPPRALPVEGTAPEASPTAEDGHVEPHGPAGPGGEDRRGARQEANEPDEEDGRQPIEVRVMGPVEIVGATTAPSRRCVELACFLAMHAGRAVTGEEIRAALWPEDTGGGAKNLRNAISLLRKALGWGG